MGSFHDHSTLPAASAKLAADFTGFYETKKRRLKRRRRDLQVLKMRAGVSRVTVPSTTKKYIEGKQ